MPLKASPVEASSCTGYLCAHRTIHQPVRFAARLVGLNATQMIGFDVFFVEDRDWDSECKETQGSVVLGCTSFATRTVRIRVFPGQRFCDLSYALVHELTHVREGMGSGHRDPFVWGVKKGRGEDSEVWFKAKAFELYCRETHPNL